ncbi:MAG: transglycosylase SLT domain-containing protein, partial [candidate division NC10 bacterium]|nr:transglycosylase SLT domain-containing protein [candidate division NC10 bacterium]
EYDLLADYSIAYAAQAAQALEDHNKTIALLSRLLTHYPKSRLAEESQFRLAKTYLEIEQHEDAEKTLRSFLDRYPKSDLAPQATLDLAKLLLDRDRPEEAVPFLKRIYLHLPTDPTATEAEHLFNETPHTVTREELILRTKALFRGGSFREASSTLTPLLQADPENEEITLLQGRILFAMKEYRRAIATLLPLTNSNVRSSLRVKTLFLMGRASLRSGRHSQAIGYLQQIPASSPRSRLADDALYLVGLNLEDRGDNGAALKVYARLMRRYPNGGWGDAARWQRAWLYYRQGKLKRAAHELEHILKDYPRSGQTAQALYWRGRMLEEMGKDRLAKVMYRRVIKQAILDPYYEYRARERLRLKPEKFSTGLPVPIENRSSRPLAKARELANLRIWGDAAAEYWEVATTKPRRISLQWEACHALVRANEYEKVVKIARNAVYTLLKKGRREEVLTTFGGFLYPRGFWPWVDQHAKETPLDPYLVTAVIREESVFSPTAVSPAGARGLMQLMPRTASRVAKQIDLPNPVDLDDPGPNIALGTRYLARLHQQFEGNVVLTLAAYNAGPHAVRRWLMSLPLQDIETFIEEIPYRETREYVKRVLGSYDRYRSLYSQPG